MACFGIGFLVGDPGGWGLLAGRIQEAGQALGEWPIYIGCCMPCWDMVFCSIVDPGG
jgi:hypothetical protein